MAGQADRQPLFRQWTWALKSATAAEHQKNGRPIRRPFLLWDSSVSGWDAHEKATLAKPPINTGVFLVGLAGFEPTTS